MMRNVFLWILICGCFVSVFSQNFYRDLSQEKWFFIHENKKYVANVPGTIHTDLMSQGLISDPFIEDNEKDVQWVEKRNWTYLMDFDLSEEELKHSKIELQCQGLDTYASLWINDVLIGNVDNLFRFWDFDVKEHLKTGTNSIKIEFYSSVNKAQEKALKLNYILPGEEKVFVRKAQYQFGWDWGPRLVTSGITDRIQLKFWDEATVIDWQYKILELSSDFAKIEWKAVLNCEKEGVYELKCNEESNSFYLNKGENNVSWTSTIDSPKLWWCAGMGQPFRYEYALELYKDAIFLEKLNKKIGLRKIEWVQEKDTIGSSFYLRLNGKRVFIKGANYIPPDSFISRVKDSTYAKLIFAAKKVHMNMLRVWGGGVYASDAFYELCDEEGIMIWQDFMFACAMYPGDNMFLENVRNEVRDQVKRLQSHPSIVIWCGNNEIDEGWHNWGWQKQFKYSQQDSTEIWSHYTKLFHDIIPKTLDENAFDKNLFYWSSSPSIGWGRKESMYQGDSHYWGVWWGKEPFEKYEEKVGRFMSEYGFQGMPTLETFYSFTKDLKWKNSSIQSHQKHPVGYETIEEYMKRDYRMPQSFEDYIYVSQLLQARGMRIAIEAHRRAKPYCGGTLYWQLNDCWPVTSWSSIDYLGNWKAFHYQLQESFAPILLSIQKESDVFKIYGINDLIEIKKGNLQIQLMDFEGNVLKKMVDKEVLISNERSTVLSQLLLSEFKNVNLKKCFLHLIFTTNDNEVIKKNYFFVKPKDLLLKKPEIQIEKIDEKTLKITTNRLVKDFYIYSEEVHFNENFFDLLPNESRVITADRPFEKWEIKMLNK